MLSELRTFFDHSRHSLGVQGLDMPLDVLAFSGDEALSQPFAYRIEFTSTDRDLTADRFLCRDASFSLRAPPEQLGIPGYTPPLAAPLRTLHGTITHFGLLSVSRDEARYEVTFAPRLQLLDRARQFRLYQNQSVPEIIEQVLRRNDFQGQDFLFELTREYPQREQVMQYGEDDLAFIQRLAAEVGIWYCFSMDARLRIEVVEFHDDQRHYGVAPHLPLRPLSSLESSGQDAVWDLQFRHKVVQQQVDNRAYSYRDAAAQLDAGVDLLQSSPTTYGEAYHYGEPHSVLGDAYAQDEDLESESGYFYARLAHERYLSARTRLTGSTSSPAVVPGQVLKTEGASQDFASGAVIVRLHTSAARDRSFEVQFEAIPYAETICFRPEVPARPVIAGTIPARVTSPEPNDLYAHIDKEGRYKCHFLFDRDTWPAGRESLWLRLARPYAGDTYGLHLPLIQGTEVRIAFENGDPDRPYIAHAIHDSQHPDHVTLQNYKRNVLRTPANNKLRMDDSRGKEHIKLSTEYSGKSQLNLGHLVDAKRQKRGEGFELRTDGWGALRAGKGVFISADVQPGAQGQALEMGAALAQLNNSLKLVLALAQSASASGVNAADGELQQGLRESLSQLTEAGLIASAPAGVALTTPQSVQLAAGRNLIATAGDSADISLFRRFSVAAGESISLFAQKLGAKLFAARGPVEIQAQTDAMALQANKNLSLSSVNGEMVLNAEHGITLVSRGAYIKLKDGSIEIGAPGDLRIRNDQIEWGGSASLDKALTPMTILDPTYTNPMQGRFQVRDKVTNEPKANIPYRLLTADGSELTGLTDEHGFTQRHYGVDPQNIQLFFD
ncbi:type VI secretion system Vgr family protein [Pseudomonas nitroreducens]|uniref:Type IV secretion protein Rhs n=1 Tax=Pseudomonas nitroreducens TaxID=46680 RepID=A0A246F812_PSENT|nr:type VI secretion system Vgr family protein [Pseudomonas nitroreducens]OWP49775.1 type IV secretion protein Rhs [Pseudomonas nitroreducens]